MLGLLEAAVERLRKKARGPTELRNIRVQNISAVARPANRRTFLIIKAARISEGSRATMGSTRAKTYDEVLAANRQARRATVTKQAALPDLSKIDFDAIADAILREALRDAGVLKVQRTAVDEVEARIAARIDRNPVTVTRTVAMSEVFEADPDLYARYRRETTIGRDGQPMSRAFRDVGVGRVAAKAETESAAAEVERRLDTIMVKESRLTHAQAMDFLFRQDPALYERWRTDRA